MNLPREPSTDKVFRYRPPGETGDPKSAHDKLNLMIVRGQDPSSFIETFNSSPDPKKIVSAEKPSALQLRLRYVGQQHEQDVLKHQPLPGTIAHSHRHSLVERG